MLDCKAFMPPVGSHAGAQSRREGAKPPETESNNLKLSEQYYVLNLIIWPFWCIDIISSIKNKRFRVTLEQP